MRATDSTRLASLIGFESTGRVRPSHAFDTLAGEPDSLDLGHHFPVLQATRILVLSK